MLFCVSNPNYSFWPKGLNLTKNCVTFFQKAEVLKWVPFQNLPVWHKLSKWTLHNFNKWKPAWHELLNEPFTILINGSLPLWLPFQNLLVWHELFFPSGHTYQLLYKHPGNITWEMNYRTLQLQWMNEWMIIIICVCPYQSPDVFLSYMYIQHKVKFENCTRCLRVKL